MVALLVAMSIMAIMMTAAMPAWHTMAQREKEAELVFRGEQIARAIGLYQRGFANAPAPSVDALVEQRFLRKKYKDPITNDDFQVLTPGGNQPGQTQAVFSTGGRQTTAASPQTAGRGAAPAGRSSFQLQSSFGTPNAGIVGVTSKSPLKSLRLYNNQDTYDKWVFMPVQRAGGAGGRGADGRGGRGADGRGAIPQGGGRGQDGRGGDGRGAGPQGGRGGGPQGGSRGFEFPARGRF
jgi:type II secretory pathway pseudopilin PulG